MGPAAGTGNTGSAPVRLNRFIINSTHPIIPETGTGQSRCIVPYGPPLAFPVFKVLVKSSPAAPPLDITGRGQPDRHSSAVTAYCDGIFNLFSIFHIASFPIRAILIENSPYQKQTGAIKRAALSRAPSRVEDFNSEVSSPGFR